MRKSHSKGTLGRPVVVAMAVAGFGVLAMLVVDHGPWSRPKVQTAEVANYKTTGEAAQAAGATVTPTAPKPVLEPIAPEPKPAQPADPATPQAFVFRLCLSRIECRSARRPHRMLTNAPHNAARMAPAKT
jgi:hypothetical protein